MDYNYVMVSRGGGAGDHLMIEPTIEALYYQFAPARIILRTHWWYPWVLEDHPLIWKVIFDDYTNSQYHISAHNTVIRTSLNGLLEENTPVRCYHFNDVIEAFHKLHGVDAFSMFSDVRILRRTPSIGHYNFQENHKIVVQIRKNGDIRDFYGDNKPLNQSSIDMLNAAGALFIGPEKLENKLYKDTICGCEMFIGPDSSGLHLASAAGVKKIIGYYEDRYPAQTRTYPGIFATRNSQELHNAIEFLLNEPKYPDYLNKMNSTDYIRGKALTHCQGNGLDISRSLIPLSDSIPVMTKDFTSLNPLDFIFSSHLLQYTPSWQNELQLYNDMLRPGGILFLYLPHPRMEIWAKESVWKPEPILLTKYINENTNFKVEEYSAYPDSFWSFYMVLRKTY